MKVSALEAAAIAQTGKATGEGQATAAEGERFVHVLDKQRVDQARSDAEPAPRGAAPIPVPEDAGIELTDTDTEATAPGEDAPALNRSWVDLVHNMTRDSREVARRSATRPDAAPGAATVPQGVPPEARLVDTPRGGLHDPQEAEPDLVAHGDMPVASAAPVAPAVREASKKVDAAIAGVDAGRRTAEADLTPASRFDGAVMSPQIAAPAAFSATLPSPADRYNAAPDPRLRRVQAAVATSAEALPARPEPSLPAGETEAASPALLRTAASGAMQAGAGGAADAALATAPAAGAATTTLFAPAASASIANPAPVNTGHVAAPVGSSHWGASLGEAMMSLARGGDGQVRHIELRLDPPHLGPLHVSLQLQGEQASAVFASAQPAVRAALEAALPQLQQTLADAGIQLGQSSVGEHAQQQEAGHPASQGRAAIAGGADSEGDGGSAMPLPRMQPVRGLIDTFA